MPITTDEIRTAGKLAGHLHQKSRDLLVDTVRQAVRDGYTQREIAAALGRSQPEVSRLLRFVPHSDHGKLLVRHRREILALARKHGFSNVRVFGSTARGDEHPGSDIDLLVDRTPAPSMFELGRFEHAVASLLDLPVDIVPAIALKPRLARTVLEEAIPL
jgi:predicted nucleotidyltransferase